jgi:hypothetical protein
MRTARFDGIRRRVLDLNGWRMPDDYIRALEG